jgi:hypothetical protein
VTTLRQRFFDTTTITLFVLALLAPTTDQLVRPDEARDSSLAEQRKPEPRPALPTSMSELARFPKSYEGHYEDTFGLRDKLLRWNGIERALGLGVVPAKTVELAGDGWCFFLGDRARESYRGLIPFTEGELDLWVKRLRERRDFAASVGAKYLFVMCPGKEVLYPERLPATWAKVGPSRLEQLFARLEREGDVPFLDLRPALRAAKEDDAEDDWIYTRAGTHWNGHGAYAAYRAILARLAADFPGLEPVPFAACEAREKIDSLESLARLLYLSDLLPQRHYGVVPKTKHYEVLLETPPRTGSQFVTRRDGDGPRLLWLHDSFGPLPLMSENFSYVQAHRVFEFSRDEVRQARPDVVLEMYVDRILNYQRPDLPMTGLPVSPEEQFTRMKDLAWRHEAGDRFAPAQAFGRALLEQDDQGLTLSVLGPRDGLLLPELEVPKGRFALLSLTGETTEPVEVDVFVRAVGEPTFPLQNHVAFRLTPEHPNAATRLPNAGTRIETLVRPRPPQRDLRLTELEIRRSAPGR